MDDAPSTVEAGATQLDVAWPQVTVEGAPYGTLAGTSCKEQFSLAYVHSIIAAARCVSAKPEPDMEGIDLTIRQTADHARYTSSCVDVQMKCTSQSGVLKDDGVHWQLERAHYNALVNPKTYNRKILVLMVVPRHIGQWIDHSDEHSLLRRSAFWVNLEGQDRTEQQTKTVVLPSANRFDVGQLLSILQRIGDGGAP